MRATLRSIVFAITMGLIVGLSWAQDPAQLQALKDAKALLDAQAAKDAAEAAAIKAAIDLAKAKVAARDAERDLRRSQEAADAKSLLDAQAARDNSQAAAIKAASDLAKAKAAATDVTNDIQKAHLDSSAALTKAQVGAQTAQIDALKATFGAAPSIGTDGNITITESTTGVLLQVKAGSLAVTWELADKLCAALAAAKVTDAFVAPLDLDTKIQSARMVLREFNALTDKVRDPANRKLVGLDGIQAQLAPAAILGAVSMLQYGAGALQSVAKLFKSDYAVGLSSDATRAGWLEYFLVAKCPKQVPKAHLEAASRSQSIDAVLGQLNDMLEFYNAAVTTKSGIQKQIDLITARITQLKADKKEDQIPTFQAQLDAQNQGMLAIVSLDVWLPRIQALITSVQTTPAAFLDALTWHAFGDAKHSLQLSAKPRLTAVLTTQDGQITKTFWLTGKKMYGRSSGELVYRVTKADGSVVTVGFLTGTSSTGEVEFAEKKKAEVVDLDRHVP